MRESFVIHSEFIEDLPEDYKERFLQMVYNYGIHEEVPILNGLEQSLWIKIQRRIDADRDSYETRKQKLREYKENWKKKNQVESLGIIQNQSESFGIIPTDTHSVYDTVNDIVSVNVNDIDIVSVNDIVSDSDGIKDEPIKITPSQKKYSKELFNIFKDAGLPCAKNNEISFMQTDFLNGISYLHKTPEYAHISSSDVIDAVKNYITILNDQESYVSNKMNFYSLVKSKIFYNLLPSNFSAENFKKFGTAEKKESEEQKTIEKEYRECPNCKQKKLWLHPSLNYVCDYCFQTFDRKEIK